LPKICLSILYKSHVSGVCREQQIHDINKQTVSFHHHLLQPPFDCHPPPLCMLTTTTTRHCHVTSWMKHDGSWWQPGMSTDVPRHPDADNACCCHCPHNFRWAATQNERTTMMTNERDNDYKWRTTTWHINRHAASSRWWWRQASSLSTLIQVSDSCPLTFVNMKAGPCSDVSTNNGRTMTDNNEWCYNA